MRNYFYWTMSFCDHQTEGYNKRNYFCISPMLQLFFLQKHKAQMFHLRLNEKSYGYSGLMENKWFCPFLHNPDFLKFTKSAEIFDTSR